MHAVSGAAARNESQGGSHGQGQKDLLSLVQSAVGKALDNSDFSQGPRRGPGLSVGRRAAVGPLGEVLLLDAVAAEAAGALAPLQGVAGLRRSLGRTFSAVSLADHGPQVLSRLGERLSRSASGEGIAARVAELGRLYQRYRSLLGPHRLDAALTFAQGSRLLRVGGVREITVTGLHRLTPWDSVPTPHGLLQALLSLLRPIGGDKQPVEVAGRLLRIVLPAVDEERPALEQSLKPLLDAIYERHSFNIEVAWAPLGPAAADDAAETPWGRFVRGLFLPLGQPPLVSTEELSSKQLSVSALPSPRTEARQVARAIRDLLSAGVRPDDIAVIAESASRRLRIIEELQRYDVPVRSAPPPPTSLLGIGERDGEPLPPPLLIILALYELFGAEAGPGQALSREALIQLLTTRYLRWPLAENAPAVRPWQIARALRGAGVRDLSLLAGADSAAELHRRVGEWQRQQRHPSDGDGALLHHLEAILGELRTLPEQAPLAQHVTALRRLCERLQLRRLAVSPESAWLGRSSLDGEEEGEDDGHALTAELIASECRALARDQAALELLDELLDELPRRAQLLRLPDEPLSRPRFAAILRAALLRLRPATRLGQDGLGVEVSSLAELMPRPLAQLFIVGMLDGELPAAAPEDQLLGDEERRQCNRLLDAPVFPLAQHAGQRAALYFAEAVAHTTALHISFPIADEEGRPLLRSPFVDVVLHAAARGEPPLKSEPLVPDLDAARHAAELWTRAGQAAGQTAKLSSAKLSTETDGAAAATLSALASYDRRRAARLTSRVQMEAARADWFLAFGSGDVGAQPGPLAGQLSNAALIAALAPRLPGSRERPLSASALEDYARCPFRFFVYRVLQAAPIPEGGDDLDPLARGNLYHKVLELFFADRRDHGRLPLLADDDDRAALEKALDAALAEFAEAERGGHPGLFQVRVRRLRAELWGLIKREAQAPIEPGLTPRLLEHKFGPLAITGADDAGGSALHIGGIIDRIDVGKGRALVLDYKTGRLKRYQEYLRGELLVTSFQLPLYAAAVQADPAVIEAAGASPPHVTARFYAVRQAQVTEALDDPGLITIDLEARRGSPQHNVAEAAHRLWRRLRGGDFRVAPRTCDGCGLEAVCRIAVPPVLPDRDSDSDDESQKSSSQRSSSQTSQSGSSATPSE